MTETINLIKEKISTEMQMLDHFYNGDKDTLNLAYSNILENKGINSDDFDKELFYQYQPEIDKEFARLTEYGETRMSMLKNVEGYMNELIKNKE